MNKIIIAAILLATICCLVEADYKTCFEKFKVRVAELETPKELKDIVESFCKTNPDCEGPTGPRCVGNIVYRLIPVEETWEAVDSLPEEEQASLVRVAEEFISKSRQMMAESGCTPKDASNLADYGRNEFEPKVTGELLDFRGYYILSQRIVEASTRND